MSLTGTKGCARCENGNTGHPQDCVTVRGRKLARICRKCGVRFALYSSRSNRVHCPECIEDAAKRRERRAPKVAPVTLAAVRERLECDADPRAMMYRVANMRLLESAVGNAMFCPECDGALDAPKSVLFQIGGRWQVRCASCFDADPALYAAADEVHDGRFLCGPNTRRAAGFLAR